MKPTGESGLTQRQIDWAHRYDGYARLGGTPEDLLRLIEPARADWQRTGQVPQWCGVDLLRGWAFYITRADRHGGGYGLAPGGSALPEWRAVLGAVAAHRAASGSDVPPMQARPDRPGMALSSAPRMHGDAAFLAAKRVRVFEPHVAPINHYARELEKGHPAGVPFVDPDSGGITARVLLVLEAPARAAAHGSGMLSADNDDSTAANVWAAYAATGLERPDAVHWNAVPWYLGTATKLAPPTEADVIEGRGALHHLTEMLPDLRVVVALGAKARDSIAPLRQALERSGIEVLFADHPSQRRYNLTRDAAKASVHASFADAARIIARDGR